MLCLLLWGFWKSPSGEHTLPLLPVWNIGRISWWPSWITGWLWGWNHYQRIVGAKQKLGSLVIMGLHTDAGLPPCRLLLCLRTKKQIFVSYLQLLCVLLSFVANPHPRSCFSYKTRKLLDGRNICVHFCLPQSTLHSAHRTRSLANLCKKRSWIQRTRRTEWRALCCMMLASEDE